MFGALSYRARTSALFTRNFREKTTHPDFIQIRLCFPIASNLEGYSGNEFGR
jgi:hypothetical protein